MQRVAEPVQDIGTVELAPPVIEGMKRRIGDARLFLKPVASPALTPENLLQRADDHGNSLGWRWITVKTLYLYSPFYSP